MSLLLHAEWSYDEKKLRNRKLKTLLYAVSGISWCVSSLRLQSALDNEADGLASTLCLPRIRLAVDLGPKWLVTVGLYFRFEFLM